MPFFCVCLIVGLMTHDIIQMFEFRYKIVTHLAQALARKNVLGPHHNDLELLARMRSVDSYRMGC
jgi:hypothetical protein